MKILDHGYLELIEAWGSDERIIEAARMSTNKGFLGWTFEDGTERDAKLLRYLWNNKHSTPFEMAGMTVEVQAPLFVVREWHRHRTQSYNEMSARYTPLPDINYLPTRERIIEGAKAGLNKQAVGIQPLLTEAIEDWQEAILTAYTALENTYQTGLELGIPKELARIIIPVGRYTRMRASANLRNWLSFLTLRMASNAQWEIRQYANGIFKIVEEQFPRTAKLFQENNK
jgi:thymidylate synthase (FAD)